MKRPQMIVKLIYQIRHKCPRLWRMIEGAAGLAVRLRYGRRIEWVLAAGVIEGTIFGASAVIRPLGWADLQALQSFIAALPPAHLTYFQPHGFGREALAAVLARRDICTYGLFQQEKLVAYAILKIFPTGKGFMGTLVAPSFTNGGIGKFLGDYLCWQANRIGVMPATTIHSDNLASLRSYQAQREVAHGGQLTNGYSAFYYPPMVRDRQPPRLCLERKTNNRPEIS